MPKVGDCVQDGLFEDVPNGGWAVNFESCEARGEQKSRDYDSDSSHILK